MSKKIALLQVWFGPFPDYFDAHLQSCKNQNPNINFFIFTDQNININAPNIKVYNITKEAYKNLVYNKTNIVADISENRKLCDYKLLAAHLFEGYLSEYDYVGFYDIDCIFGDMYDMLFHHLDKDIISIGDTVYYPGVRGPFTIWKNLPHYNHFYKNIPDHISLLQDSEYKGIDEHHVNKELSKHDIQITSFSELTNTRKDGRYIGEAVYKNKKLYIKNRESLLAHFYYKNDLSIQDNLFYNKKILLEDFYWVVYFDKKYEHIAKEMLRTISMFSNRKCIIYSLNYALDVTKDLELNKEQFISVPFHIFKDEMQNIDLLRNIKPFCLKDSCERYPNTNFVYIDTDCFLTATADHISKYVSKLSNHPLMNIHLHGTIFHVNYLGSGQNIHGLQVLSDALNIPITVYPRRKANIIVYNSNHHNFFSEAVDIYQTHKNTKLGIFALHDEDTFNILLSKYNYTDSLITVDIEETNELSLQKYNEYGASERYSPLKQIPNHTNDIYCFHGIKSISEFNDIKDHYLKKVFSHDELYCSLLDNEDTFQLSRKNFIAEKQFSEFVDIKIYNKKGNLLLNFERAEIFKYFHFYSRNFAHNLDHVYVKITECDSGNIIFSNFMKIHK